MQALGMIETKGTLATIEAADVMLKTADVSLLKKEKVRGGLVMVSVVGDVAAVKAAVDAGKGAVEQLGSHLLYGAHVIPRPDSQLEGFYQKNEAPVSPKPEMEKETDIVEEIEEETEIQSPQDILESKDEEEIKKFLEKMTVNELTKLSQERQLLTDVDLTKLRKRELIEQLTAQLIKESGGD